MEQKKYMRKLLMENRVLVVQGKQKIVRTPLDNSVVFNQKSGWWEQEEGSGGEEQQWKWTVCEWLWYPSAAAATSVGFWHPTVGPTYFTLAHMIMAALESVTHEFDNHLSYILNNSNQPLLFFRTVLKVYLFYTVFVQYEK